MCGICQTCGPYTRTESQLTTAGESHCTMFKLPLVLSFGPSLPDVIATPATGGAAVAPKRPRSQRAIA